MNGRTNERKDGYNSIVTFFSLGKGGGQLTKISEISNLIHLGHIVF